ncbi:MAG: TolC family protein [Phycisphaerales bacterium]|nr:MAG: TolC family protein [Phycisphaerales bacterium]
MFETRTLKRNSMLCALLFLAALGVVPAIGCRAPLSRVRIALQRHREAVEKLPEETQTPLPVLLTEDAAAECVENMVSGDALTLDTARRIAIRSNPDIHAAQARLENARWRIAEARSAFLPTLVLTHNWTKTFHTPASRNRLNTALQPASTLPTDVSTQGLAVTTLLNAIRGPLFGLGKAQGDRNPFSEHSTAFTVSWTVFDGFVREARLLAAKHLHHASKAALVDAKRLIIQAVDAAYYQVQFAEEQLRIAEADEVFSLEQLEETEKLRAAGRATIADVANFRVRMLSARANVTAARGARETGRVVLTELLGADVDTLNSELQLSPLEDETEENMTTPDPGPWIERAMTNRPDIQQIENVLRSDAEQIRAAKGLYVPSIAVSGSWGYDRSSNIRYSVEDQSSAAGLEFRWELYSGGYRRSRVHQAESSRAETSAKLSRLRLAVQSQVRQAVIDLENAQEQIVLRREALDTAAENRRVVQVGYVAGKETLTRLNEVQRDFITAEADLALARVRLRQAWSDLHAAAATYPEMNGGSNPD